MSTILELLFEYSPALKKIIVLCTFYIARSELKIMLKDITWLLSLVQDSQVATL